jgi:hypothetical protein
MERVKLICSFMEWDCSMFNEREIDLNHFCKAWNVGISTFLCSDLSNDDAASLYFRLKNTSPIFTIEGKINILTDIIEYLMNRNIKPNPST